MNQLFEDGEFLSKLKVLYVEDSDKLREQTAIFLKKIFTQVSVAEDGEKGWSLAQQNHYDIVITDIKMPKMGGLKMSRNIKKLRPDTQIIITSAYEDIEFLKESIKIGIVEYIVKPIHSKEFLSSILKAVKTIKTNKNLNSMLKTYEKSFDSQVAMVFLLKTERFRLQISLF